MNQRFVNLSPKVINKYFEREGLARVKKKMKIPNEIRIVLIFLFLLRGFEEEEI